MNKIKQAVILAGGRGSRLGILTSDIPKPLIKVGDMPVIEHQIKLLHKYGVRRILITANYHHEALSKFAKKIKLQGLQLQVYVEKEPLGTAGAFPSFMDDLEEHFFILYGDVMLDMDLDRLIAFHFSHNSDITLVTHSNDHPQDSDLIETDGANRISRFIRKPHENGFVGQNLVNAGLYLMSKSIINGIPFRNKFDFVKDLFPTIISTKQLYSYRTSEYLKDMGTPERLERIRIDFAKGIIQKRNLSNPQKAIFLDRDGVLNYDIDLISKPKDLILYDFTVEAISKINKSDYLCIVVTNQSVVARNLCTINELEAIHRKLDMELAKGGAKLDALYYCPFHPDKGYPEENPNFKSEHHWRKPNDGMLLQAANDYNINLSESYMIGDRETDIEAGRKAGVITIGVDTGYGLKSRTINPDFFFKNLNKAVEFIIENNS